MKNINNNCMSYYIRVYGCKSVCVHNALVIYCYCIMRISFMYTLECKNEKTKVNIFYEIIFYIILIKNSN